MSLPIIQKKKPSDSLPLLPGNLLLVGYLGSGKTLALKTFASEISANQQRVLMVDHFMENVDFTLQHGGESIEIDSLFPLKDMPPLTNLVIPYDSIRKNPLLSKVILDTLDTFVLNQTFDYIFIDEAQRYFTEELSDSLIDLLSKAEQYGVQVFLCLQTLARFPIRDEAKKKLLEVCPQVLYFEGIDIKMQTSNSISLTRGESILFHTKKPHPLTAIPFLPVQF